MYPSNSIKHLFRRFIYEVRNGNTELAFMKDVNNLSKEECIELLHKVQTILYPNITDTSVYYIDNKSYAELVDIISDLIAIYFTCRAPEETRLTPLELCRCAYNKGSLSITDLKNLDKELMEW